MTLDLIFALLMLLVMALGFGWATVAAARNKWHVVPICCFGFCALITTAELVSFVVVVLRHGQS